MLETIVNQQIDELLFEIIAFPILWAIINRYQRKGVRRGKVWTVLNWTVLSASTIGILGCAISGRGIYQMDGAAWRMGLVCVMMASPFGAAHSSLIEKRKNEMNVVAISALSGIALSLAAAAVRAVVAHKEIELLYIVSHVLGTTIGAMNLMLVPYVERIGQYLHRVTEHD